MTSFWLGVGLFALSVSQAGLIYNVRELNKEIASLKRKLGRLK